MSNGERKDFVFRVSCVGFRGLGYRISGVGQVHGLWFMVYGLRFRIHDFKCFREVAPGGANHKPFGSWPGIKISLKVCVSRIHTRGGVQYPTPHSANPVIVKCGKARGGGGVVPGGVTPRAFPQVRRCV